MRKSIIECIILLDQILIDFHLPITLAIMKQGCRILDSSFVNFCTAYPIHERLDQQKSSRSQPEYLMQLYALQGLLLAHAVLLTIAGNLSVFIT